MAFRVCWKTMAAAAQAGMRVVGAGKDLEEAQTPLITHIAGQRIVVHAMAEREFSLADSTTGGANPLDLISFVAAIQSHKREGVFLVLVHGGKEYYPYPPPEMVRKCRFMVDMGADAVICCHSHGALPWEMYRGRPIAYGLGNLIFESASTRPTGWHEGYLVRLTIDDTAIGFEAIPYCQSREQIGARRLPEDAEKDFVAEMQQRNEDLQNSALLDDHWLRYCREQADRYLPQLFGYKPAMARFRRFLLNVLHSEEEFRRALNLVQCETHREVIITILRDRATRG